MTILGIDPGLNTTGYAAIASLPGGPKLIEGGVIRSEKLPTAELALRLASLYEGIVELLDQFSPAALAVEELYSHYEHPRTAILMGHARGVILLAAGQRKIPLHSYSATSIKKSICGNGRANKEQMQYTILRELHLKALPEPHDVSDAIAIALCHHYRRNAADLVSESA